MKECKILVLPKTVKTNQFIERFNDILNKSAKVDFHRYEYKNLKDLFSLELLSSIFTKSSKLEAILIHWHDNHLIGSDYKLSFKGFLKYFGLLIYFKLISKKIYYFHHNYYPHCLSGFEAYLAKKLISYGSMISDLQFTMNPADISKKIKYIPHPLYMPIKYEKNNVDENIPFYLLYGRILPYKQYQNVINNWQSETKLIIAGGSPSKDYLEYLKSIIKSKNITIDPNFQNNLNTSKLFTTTKSLILPQINSSSRVSGNLFLALSYQTPVMAIKNSFADSVKKYHSLKNIFLFDDINSLCDSANNKCLKNERKFDENINSQFSDSAIEFYFRKYLDFTHR